MILYKPGVFEDFSKSARRMVTLANRTGKKVYFVIDGIRYIAKPGSTFRGLIKFRQNMIEKDYARRYLTPQAREDTRIWIISRFNEINSLCAEHTEMQKTA